MICMHGVGIYQCFICLIYRLHLGGWFLAWLWAGLD